MAMTDLRAAMQIILKPWKSICTEVKGKIQCLRSSQELLVNVVYSPDQALARNFGAESYVPKNARKGKNEACKLGNNTLFMCY